MKKNIVFIITIIVLLGCASRDKSAEISDLMTLDQAIQMAALSIDERLPAKTKIALLNFDSPADDLSEYVIDELTANLVDSGKLTVVDRKEIDLIRDEFEFQFSGEVSDDSMQKAGRILGAQSIVSGSLKKLGSLYRIVVRVLTVQSAEVVVQYRANIAGDDVVRALLAGGKTTSAQTVVKGKTVSPPPAPEPAKPAAQVKQEYNIGETGPAGGIVFYDKKQISEGWRYLEAAPASSEFIAGRSEAMRRSKALVVNGRLDITGWRLPTQEELNLMYERLHKQGLGGFNDSGIFYSSYYWSSSNDNYGYSCYQDFSNGSQSSTWGWAGAANFRVRVIRQF
jgi:TolB-like protein